jgi:asparagine synthase (glutamine-hydrolysing)
MCGICGKFFLTDESRQVSRASLEGMMASMDHRGPDEHGMYFFKNVGLGHKRLRIIDLNTGAQPLSNEDNTVWVVYNGEIYNYLQLRQLLLGKGHQFRTMSDTEVIVHLYEEFGEGLVPKLDGMFSFALWDQKTGFLMLARDRVGIKPLYYCRTKDALLFASEIKAILSDPTVTREIDPHTIDSFLRFGYVSGERTLFGNIQKLQPGHYLTVSGGELKTKEYWDLKFSDIRKDQGIAESVQELDELLGKTIRNHIISDVPVGVLLSGGVDSTALLSYAAQSVGMTLSTFTIGFDEYGGMDERLSARAAASRFGTKHFEATFTARDFAECLPKCVWHMEEPVCEPPAIALYFITKLAREHVTVLLSGEGGDEAFAGYKNYRDLVWLERLKAALGPLMPPFAQVCKTVAEMAGSQKLRRFAAYGSLAPEQYYHSRTSNPLSFFNVNRDSLYTGQFAAQLEDQADERFPGSMLRNPLQAQFLQQLLYIDTKTWLPDDLLVKADKMSMANSVELRVPFLDHHVLEFAASLPARHKLRGFETKYVLKRALSTRVPKQTLKRPKTGFPVPYNTWLRTELKGFAWDILTDPATLRRGYFQQDAVERLLRQNARDGSCSKEMFSLIVLELWHRAFADTAH